MKKRSIVFFIVVILVILFAILSSSKNNKEIVKEENNTVEVGNVNNDDEIDDVSDLDSRYYATGSGNIFVKLAKLIDKICYYIIDAIIGGITSLFSLILGN